MPSKNFPVYKTLKKGNSRGMTRKKFGRAVTPPKMGKTNSFSHYQEGLKALVMLPSLEICHEVGFGKTF